MSNEPMCAAASFTRLQWLAPVAYAAHFVEEYIGFPRWVSAHFATSFSQAQFQRNGAIFMATLVGLCVLVSRLRRKTAVLLFLTYVAGLFLHNGIFHLGATALLQTYSPGLATGLLLHLPLSLLLASTALREGLVSRSRALVAFVVGGIVHYAFIAGQLT